MCVSPYYADLTRERTGWPADKVDGDRELGGRLAARPTEAAGARFHIGMVGIGETRKRFDLALDVLEEVRRHDPRFRLFAKTKMPWDYAWIWRRPGEPETTDAYLRRIQVSERLRGAVVFDQFGPDVASWLRRVGFVLSTSDDESFHLAPAEGMASGAIPIVRSWPGADTIYESRWIYDDPSEMAHTHPDRGSAGAMGAGAHDRQGAGARGVRSRPDRRFLGGPRAFGHRAEPSHLERRAFGAALGGFDRSARHGPSQTDGRHAVFRSRRSEPLGAA